MLATLAACLLAPQAASVTDFFPMQPGDRWVYEEKMGKATSTVTDTVESQIKIADEPVTPIVSVYTGERPDRAYYSVRGDAVWLVAFQMDALLEAPYPIIKVAGDAPATWNVQGTTFLHGSQVPLTVKGTSRRVADREFFGAKREILEVKLEARIDGGKLQDMGVIETTQICTYAKGIGLVEMTDTQVFNRKKTERKRKLISYKLVETR